MTAMKVVGYADRLSVQPGQTIKFMVSCEHPSYRADIVRLIHGDPNPQGPGFKEQLVDSPVNGDYTGIKQDFHIGSYVVVPDNLLLQRAGSFTLQAWIYPTTPDKGAQGILTKWSGSEGVGYGLFIDDDGSLALWLGDQSGRVEKVSTGNPLRKGQWYFVAGVYDAEDGKVRLYQEPASMWPKDDSRAASEGSVHLSSLGVGDVSFLMAGYWDQEEEGRSVVQGCFNGKIDRPRLFGRALESGEIDSLRDGHGSSDLEESVIGLWDFGRDFSSDAVTDASPNELHGKTVNMPARGMTGHNWTGKEANYNHAPQEYGAIYFHDDDLDDAGWEVGFELMIPEDMRSGVYAARLRSGEVEGSEDHVPFFVRPRRGTSTASIVFLVPTNSYYAYANFHTMSDPNSLVKYSRIAGRKLQIDYPSQPQDKYIVEHNIHSLYDRHTDGSGVAYSSRLRPNMTMRPKYNMQLLGMGEGAPHQLNADLHLLDWMEKKGYEFDLVTDEDLHFEGVSLLAPYLVMVTGSHPEYWSEQMLDSMEEYQSDGGRVMYLGGNGFYWVTSFAPDKPHIIEVRRWQGTEAWEADPGEYHHSTTGELGGLWRFRGRPPQKLLGVGFSSQGFDYSVPFHKKSDSTDSRAAFIFEDVSSDGVIGDYGLVMGGAGGFEVDRTDPALGTPPHALVLASATGFSDVYQHVIEEVLSSNPLEGGTKSPLVRGDMVYFEGPKGGAVFSVGSIAWCGSLSHNNYDNDISRITGNVLTRFSSEEPIT